MTRDSWPAVGFRPVNEQQSILLADDDATVVDVVERYLRRDGYQVESVGDGITALDVAITRPPDLLILDLMLPGLDGFEVCRQLRALAPVPVIMLTARTDEADRIIGLELGADDYVSKPFSPRELTARVKAVLRRAQGPLMSVGHPIPALRIGHVELDVASRLARVDGHPLVLTAREFELLAFLMRNSGRAFRREELLQEVWGYSTGDTSTVTVHVRRLREKLEIDPAHPTMLVTVWGIGYRFNESAHVTSGGKQ
jgi:two-component system response regulator ResD